MRMIEYYIGGVLLTRKEARRCKLVSVDLRGRRSEA